MRLQHTLLLLLFSIIPATGTGETTLPQILATLDFDREEAMVKEQILLTLRVGHPAGAFAKTQTTLTAGSATLVSLKKTESTEKHRGMIYDFVQTTYALFANSAGEITLSGMSFNALLPVSAGGSDSTINPEINASIESTSIKINPAPVNHPALKDTKHQWLAASDVTMTSQWALPEETLTPGLPLQRTIVINVSGQLPAAVAESLNMHLPDKLRAYPAAVSRVIEKTASGPGGSVTLPVTLVAGTAGKFILPEISLPWWDINQRKWRTAVLGEEVLEVIPLQNSKKFPVRIALAIAAAGLICLAIAVAFSLRRRLQHAQIQPQLSEKQAWRLLKQSVRSGNDRDTRNAMLTWARSLTPGQSITRLEQLSARYPKLHPVVSPINQRLYGRSQKPVANRQSTLKALKDVRQSVLAENKINIKSKGLYPERIVAGQ